MTLYNTYKLLNLRAYAIDPNLVKRPQIIEF